MDSDNSDSQSITSVDVEEKPYPLSKTILPIAKKRHRRSIGNGGGVFSVFTDANDFINSFLNDPTLSSDGKVIRRTPPFESPIGRVLPTVMSQYVKYFDDEGRVIDKEKLKLRVFSGGAMQPIRKTLWGFLLGLYDYKSTFEERAIIKRENKLKYEEMLREVTHGNRGEMTKHEKEIRDQIDKDIQRNDRDVGFFAGDGNENLIKLKNILLTASLMYKTDTGYVQGMNDFASMTLYAAEEECEAFWMYTSLLEINGPFFQPESQPDMDVQFRKLLDLVGQHDEKIHRILTGLKSNNILFAYRWMLLNFKREFNFGESMIINETIWAMPTESIRLQGLDFGKNPYVLFIALAVILLYRDDIIKIEDYSEIMIYMNSLSNHLDITEVLCKAECLFWEYIDGRIPPSRAHKVRR